MIQRIQTVYLLLTVILTALLFFMPVASLTIPNEFSYQFYTTKVIQAGEPEVFIAYNWMSMILNILITVLSILIIFYIKTDSFPIDCRLRRQHHPANRHARIDVDASTQYNYRTARRPPMGASAYASP